MKVFFYELIQKLKSYKFNNNDYLDRIISVENGINDFISNLENFDFTKNNCFSIKYDNNIKRREFLTALQGIFGNFTGENLKNHCKKNYKIKCALIMITNTICTPFYLNFLDSYCEKEKFVKYCIEKNISNSEDSNLVLNFLNLRSAAIKGFLEISGNFINIFEDDYKKFEMYTNIDEKILELKKKFSENLYYKKNVAKISDFENNAFYVIRRKKINSDQNSEDLVFIINVKNSQISSQNQIKFSEIQITSLNMTDIEKNQISSNLINFLNQNSVNLQEILTF